MSLLEYILDWNAKNNIECQGCSHPSGKCEHNCDCQGCLNEIHFSTPKKFYDENGKLLMRHSYDCPKLIEKYISKYLERYCENIKFACTNSIRNFDNYPFLSICSIGCGPSPDLMAFVEIAGEKAVFYCGIDNNPLWFITHSKIEEFFIINSIYIPIIYLYDEVNFKLNSCNIIVIQYLISSLLKTGCNESNILDLFDIILKDIVSKWDFRLSPFLIILNDNDSCNTGRNTFCCLIDKLEIAGYNGNAYAFSEYSTDKLFGTPQIDLRKNKNIKYFFSSETKNNSAILVIEVKK